MSTFSEHGSFRMTSGAIHATVPANDILVLFSFHVRLVPKSDILTISFLATKTLQIHKEYTINKQQTIYGIHNSDNKYIKNTQI